MTNLAKIADLKVIGRTSVMSFRDTKRNLRDIAQTLGMAHIVEGSVQRAGVRVRVDAQLIDARTATHRSPNGTIANFDSLPENPLPEINRRSKAMRSENSRKGGRARQQGRFGRYETGEDQA